MITLPKGEARRSGYRNGLNDDDLIEEIKEQWLTFHGVHGRYPTAQEIKDDVRMFSTKTIERRFGGLMKLREKLGLKVLNYSSGETRSLSAGKSIAKVYNDEMVLQQFLCEKFGNRPNVCHQEPYIEFNGHIISDFGVYHSKGHFFVDIFSPKDIHSLKGCINHKFKKIKNVDIVDDIFYVVENDHMEQDVIDVVVSNRINKLSKNIKVLTLENFKRECQKYEACVR